MNGVEVRLNDHAAQVLDAAARGRFVDPAQYRLRLSGEWKDAAALE